jgi:hypothetical protein
MFRMFAHHDQIEDRQPALFIGKCANLIRLVAELSKEAFEDICGANQDMFLFRELVERDSLLDECW